MADSDDELKALASRIDHAKSLESKDDAEMSQGGMGQGMRAGVELVSGVAIGSVIGYFLDRWFGTSPAFFIICFFLGAIAGFRNLIRSSREDNNP